MKPDLDDLLGRLGAAPVPATGLDGLEQRVWQQIVAGEAADRVRRRVMVLAVAGAFAWGLFAGLHGADGPALPDGPFLVEAAEFLPADADRLLL